MPTCLPVAVPASDTGRDVTGIPPPANGRREPERCHVFQNGGTRDAHIETEPSISDPGFHLCLRDANLKSEERVVESTEQRQSVAKQVSMSGHADTRHEHTRAR